MGVIMMCMKLFSMKLFSMKLFIILTSVADLALLSRALKGW
jgi:hypothetical protein